ncbi:MAG: YheU family protein [Myxococcota bacterium]
MDDEALPLEIDPSSLSPEALRGVVEEFVTRDGTDYGAVEKSLDEKVRDVLVQIERGEVKIVFDPESERVNLVGVR